MRVVRIISLAWLASAPRTLYQSKMNHRALCQFVFCASLLGSFCLGGGGAWANDPRSLGKSGLPLPRFVSIAQSEANMRRGPGAEYPLIWQYTQRGWPLEIIAEHGRWRQIRDHVGTKGWMHARLLRGKRTIIVRTPPNQQTQQAQQAMTLRTRPQMAARIIAFVQAGAVGQLKNCRGAWCAVSLGGYDGWLPRPQLWGIYDFEFADK